MNNFLSIIVKEVLALSIYFKKWVDNKIYQFLTVIFGRAKQMVGSKLDFRCWEHELKELCAVTKLCEIREDLNSND